MSRIGKIPISVPKAVKLSMADGVFRAEGPKGKLAMNIPAGIKVIQQENQLILERTNELKQTRSNHGTAHRLIENILRGVTEGHKKELEIQGVGFRAQVQNNKLTANLGFSHPVEFECPKGVTLSAPKPTLITVEGVDKAAVGQIAARIRELKPPEPYKGKGIRYAGETVRRKQGKSVTK